MSVLHQLLAAGSDSPRRIVTVPHPEWAEVLTAATSPARAADVRQLYELRQAAQRTGGQRTVSIQANHLHLVLALQPVPTPPDADPA